MDMDVNNREDEDCFAMKLNNYLVSLVKWMKSITGRRDRGRLTLRGYLRHGIL